VEGGDLRAVLGGTADASVQRARDEFVVHFPHYDRNDQGPASALLLGQQKLIHPYETNVPMLFDLSRDPGEQHDLARERASETTELDRHLSEYLKSVGAQMPTANPKFRRSTPP
jgi:hypothetical protein